MAKLRRVHVSGENRLLVALPRDEYDRLLPHLEKVSLPLRDILYEANGPIAHVFFPLAGVVSLVIMDGGFTLEVGIIGNEGMVGTPVFLGADRSPTRPIFRDLFNVARVPCESLKAERAGASRIAVGRGSGSPAAVGFDAGAPSIESCARPGHTNVVRYAVPGPGTRAGWFP